jgi:hypothetical protein
MAMAASQHDPMAAVMVAAVTAAAVMTVAVMVAAVAMAAVVDIIDRTGLGPD